MAKSYTKAEVCSSMSGGKTDTGKRSLCYIPLLDESSPESPQASSTPDFPQILSSLSQSGENMGKTRAFKAPPTFAKSPVKKNPPLTIGCENRRLY